MRVIEQLIQHFWERGALTRADLRYLVEHHFTRPDQFPASAWQGGPMMEADDLLRPHVADALEDVQKGLEARAGAKGAKKGSKPAKRRPSAGRLEPLLARVAAHVAEREPYPALVELGSRLANCPTWREAATAVITATSAELETALVRTLDTRPRALAELWFWFDVEALFAWAVKEKGPLPQALARMLRARSLHEAGRATQLLKSAEIQALAALHGARRHFLALLPTLNARKGDLPRWLIPPRGAALASWPRLAWAFVIAYNAPYHRQEVQAPGVRPRSPAPDDALLQEALLLATAIDPALSLTALLNTHHLPPGLTAMMPPNWAL